jgi:DNA replication protein DnaC
LSRQEAPRESSTRSRGPGDRRLRAHGRRADATGTGLQHWICEHHVARLTGTGKTFLACALGHAACRHGLSVRYFRLSRLLDELRIARADGSYTRLLDRLHRTAALLIDDFGLQALSETERRDLLEVLEDRYGQRATLVASQLPIDHWHDIVGDATFGDAILDRLVHHAHRIHLKGASMRRHAPKATT